MKKKRCCGKKKHGSKKRAVSLVLLILLFCAEVPILINAYFLDYSGRYILTAEEAEKQKFDCILVLGAGVRGKSPTLFLCDRLNCGLALYMGGASNRLLMSGDHGRKDYDEVDVMKNYAKEKGVDANAVFMDHAGFSTYESMYRAKAVFQVKKVVIVTQRYHLYRAIYDARKLGLDAYGVVATESNYPIRIDLLNNARECLARVKDFIFCIVKPAPTFLGEAIPISSSGALTEST